jgi:serine phosphatase RsbU (regulator of sigma subunit)
MEDYPTAGLGPGPAIAHPEEAPVEVRWGLWHYFLINSAFGAFFITFIRALDPEPTASDPDRPGIYVLLGLGILTGNCVGFSCLAIGTWLRRRWAHLQPEQRTLLYFISFGAAGVVGAVVPLYVAGVLEPRGSGILVLCIGFVAAAVSVNVMIFEEMRERLATYYREVQQKERVERELRIARMVQTAMLPRVIPSLQELAIAARSLPAKEVGGDYFDFMELRDGRCVVAIADVSGKGLHAALLMSALRAGLRTLVDEDPDLAAITTRLNRLILDCSDRFNYITFVLGLLDPRGATFQYVNAGHNPPAIIHAGGEVHEEPPGDLVLGVLPEVSYRARQLELEPGDILVLYTDGMTEQHGLGDADFGLERLAAVINAHAATDVHLALDRAFKAVADFSGADGQYDDQTMVLLRRQEGPTG